MSQSLAQKRHQKITRTRRAHTTLRAPELRGGSLLMACALAACRVDPYHRYRFAPSVCANTALAARSSVRQCARAERGSVPR